MSLLHKLENAYPKLPVPLQNLACSFEGWRVGRARYDQRFWDELATAESRTMWSEDRIQEYRDERLRNFIGAASVNVPYYRRLFETDSAPVRIAGFDDLGQLPVLDKLTVQNAGADLAADVSEPTMSVHTSGTTGGGLRFQATVDAVREQWATWWRYRRWHGIQLETWCGYFGGRSVVPPDDESPPFWRFNRPARQILFSAYHMSSDNLPHYIRLLRERKPPWLHGYPSLLALLATHLVETGEDIGYGVKWITLGAENVTAQQQEIIYKAFDVKPLQHYGMAEAAANASECERGNLHIDEDFSAFEIVKGSDGIGRVVGTNFTNPAFPLIRYEVGDLAELTADGCSCGRPGRVLKSLDGRLEDYVLLRSGARLGRLDHIFKDAVNVREAQIYQEEAGRVTFRIVRGPQYSSRDEHELLAEAQKRLGSDTHIDVAYVESVERTATGKLRLVISRVG